MKRKKYYYLDPVIIRIPGIKTLFEKSVGKRDARQNQVCSNGEVHTTPFIDAKVNSYNAHIEKLLLKTTNELAPMIQEANSLLVEYSLMESHKGGELPEGCGAETESCCSCKLCIGRATQRGNFKETGKNSDRIRYR